MKFQKSLLKPQNILPMCFIGLFGLQLFLVLSQVMIVQNQAAIKARMNRVLVQENNGRTFVGTRENQGQMSSGGIKFFVQSWLKKQYSFSGKSFDVEGKAVKDGGIVLKSSNESFRVPLGAYQASFGVTTDNPNQFLYSLVQEWLPLDYFEAESTTVDFEIREMSEPKLRNEKQQIYGVEVVGQLNYRTPSRETQSRIFQRTVLVKPVEIPLEPPNELATLPEKLAYEWQSKGITVVGLTK